MVWTTRYWFVYGQITYKYYWSKIGELLADWTD